jgi:hypothetical protein
VLALPPLDEVTRTPGFLVLATFAADDLDTGSVRIDTGQIPVMQDSEMIAQELSALGHKLDELEAPSGRRREGECTVRRRGANHIARHGGDFKSLGLGL